MVVCRATDNDAVPYSSQTCRDILCHASSAHVGRTIVWLFGVLLVTSVDTTVHQLMTHLGVQSGRGRRRSIDSQRSHQQLRVAQYLSSKVGRLAHLLSGAEKSWACSRSQLTTAVTHCTSQHGCCASEVAYWSTASWSCKQLTVQCFAVSLHRRGRQSGS
jgi:hypothetical protein